MGRGLLPERRHGAALCLEPFALMTGEPWIKALVALSGVLQALAAAGFGILTWGRIRAMEP